MEELLKKLGFYNFLEKIQSKEWYLGNIILRDYKNPKKELIGYKSQNTLSGTREPVYRNYYDKKIVPCIRKSKYMAIIKDKDIKENNIFKFTNNDMVEFYSKINKIEHNFMYFTFVKVKDYKLSALLFGHSNIKSTMMEGKALYNITKICPEYSCKDGKIRNIFEVESPNGKNLKFVLEDIEIVYLNIDKLTKGYTLPLDRTIKKESKVKIYKKNDAGLPYGTMAIVDNLKRAGNIKYVEIITENNKKYLIKQNKIRVIA